MAPSSQSHCITATIHTAGVRQGGKAQADAVLLKVHSLFFVQRTTGITILSPEILSSRRDNSRIKRENMENGFPQQHVSHPVNRTTFHTTNPPSFHSTLDISLPQQTPPPLPLPHLPPPPPHSPSPPSSTTLKTKQNEEEKKSVGGQSYLNVERVGPCRGPELLVERPLEFEEVVVRPRSLPESFQQVHL